MAVDDTFGPVRHFHISTRDEAEAEEFIRQMYVGNRSRFLGAPAGARFNATVVAGGELVVGRVESTVDYRAATDPFDECLFLRVDRGCLRMRQGGTETILLAGDPASQTVTTIACRWGFPSPGRFASQYRQAYGVAPSHTLRSR